MPLRDRPDGTLFDEYVFADYSGAFDRSAQRKAIRLARASRKEPAFIVASRLTRDDLVSEFLSLLKDATRRGVRVCFGQDHQYNIPYGLALELSLTHLAWRDAIRALLLGSYAVGAPALSHPKTFASSFNAWLMAQGNRPYFWSATKDLSYCVPSRNPRGADRSLYRLTELCRAESGAGSPKPFNRVGDNGTVGGQSLVGIMALQTLLDLCAHEGVPVAAWPFDGLAITDSAYEHAHVMIEPYPTAVRSPDVAQTDDSDALASTTHLRQVDADGCLGEVLDLSELDPTEAAIVKFEGWILSHRPGTAHTGKNARR
jgi:hypothetical protein